jgi:serine/threonine protein kinase
MKILFQVINHCHANGVVHRDLKPENIMLKMGSEEINPSDVKLIDFGLCKLLPFNSKRNEYVNGEISGIVGTTYYSAPEVLD